MDRNKALDKIKKCLRLATSANAHEAAAAMRQAQALMQQYGIGQADVNMADVAECTAVAGSKRTPAKWEAQLAHTVGKAYACKMIFAAGIGRWNFIGEMAEVAGYTMTVLLRQVRQARRDFSLTRLKNCKLATKVRRADVFCEAWVHAVNEQVAAFAGGTLSPAVEQYLAHHYPDLVQQKPRDRNVTNRHKAGVRAIGDALHGVLAAADVRLSHGMTTAAPLALAQVAS
ncbi:Protein of unknown function (DUF2786) [Pseudomonas asplenii]|uniref:Uncharacterized protein n=1 Tax=Pseudomonas asplenii TaxID=53407 RepID=A0A0M9GHI1_9PSED|nr:DUF2786 domain-containing protein [Pseudomonas fuscovaginae]KPA91374.1 Protein of unknown function (DUF2786) [Pseudomonas fuscovaginae]